ncbi:hypothetical protein NOR_05812 [Metarhizium rileyi]|uniref:PH domain-containing protein n=1 Tax=Metarhizium rileyi (strain RCEF 4871) TaxID=1649241 RepID=A0A167BNZ2_METRR|nr:hypothetical protein NOR_05812 [Metarhizium rileyi RCEF 4871]
MDSLTGYLQVPPDRSQILGRQTWKTRYVAIGTRQLTGRDRQGSYGFTQNGTIGRVNNVISKSVHKNATDEPRLCVYKAKGDWEPIQQWPLSCVSDCQVQLVSHRKQGPVLPTLVVTVTDNQRKRRSSRATGFITSNKDAGVTTLWFRTPPDDHHPSLHEWSRFIMSKRSSSSATEGPVSPAFTSPFQSRSDDTSEYSPRPGSGSRGLKHKSSTATYSTGPLDRPATFSSDSPSLRSKRSDLSSPCSNNYPSQKVPYGIPEQHYTTILPGDIVSSGPNRQYQGQPMDGWASTQGKPSTMSSVPRARDSISSQSQQTSSSLHEASPPCPGETILDRAFQLGHIPGAGSYVPGQDKLSSIARFDALMRHAEEKQRKRDTMPRTQQTAMTSTFDDSDTSDDNDADPASDDSDVEGEANTQHQGQSVRLNAPLMSPSAQRALAYIAGRHDGDGSNAKSHRPSMSRNHLSFHADSAPTSTIAPPSRPHTAHAKSRPSASRAQSTPHLLPTAATALDLPSSGKGHASGQSRPSTIAEKRHSNSSAKRLSFTEFTKRLSSTSSLLLVQTNTSGGSSHISSEFETQPSSSAQRTSLTLRGTGPPPRPRDREDQDRRCRWRSNVGMVGAEGGFL